jgi:diguanylate cyclase (GGDEF)-like protein
MTDDSSSPAEHAADARKATGMMAIWRERRVFVLQSAAKAGALLAAVMVIAVIARWMMGGRPAHTSWAVQLLLGVVTVTGIAWGAWQRYVLWTLPVRKLGQVVEQVRKGELPIDEISRVDGIPGLLVPVLKDLLIDLRSRRAEIQQLEQEMNQRVANRTDALERMLGTLRERAARDTMTGLYNRRMLDETLPKLVEQRNQDGRPLSLLMIDVDYFKLLNDTLGHAAGDELLRAIGQIIRSTARTSDLAFRCGGDEFVVVMNDADAPAARALADRLISLVDALAKTLRVEKKPRLSIGVAVLHELPEPTPTALLAEADKALYKVKGQRKRAA